MNRKEVLLVLTDRWADWEPAYAISDIRMSELYEVRTIAMDRMPKESIGGIRAGIDYTLADYRLGGDTAMLILPGGFTWDTGDYQAIADFVRDAEGRGIPVAAICGATMFLARHGFLDDRRHSGDDPQWFAELPGYQGMDRFAREQAVTDRGFITANETAALEFSREIAKALRLCSDEEIQERYEYMKNGMFRQKD